MLIVLSITRILKCLEMNHFMPEKTVLLITAALGLSQRLVIQNKLPNGALNLFPWNSVDETSALQLTLTPGVSSTCCVVSLYLQPMLKRMAGKSFMSIDGSFPIGFHVSSSILSAGN